MKKAYVIFPVLAMLIFFGFWWNFRSQYDAKLAEKAKVARQVKEDKLKQEAKDRERAIKEALASQESRKKEREAREAQLLADREARQAAKEASEKAFRDKEKLARQVERLSGDVSAEKAAIAKVEETKRILVDDEAFLRRYVAQAEANQKNLLQVNEKIIAADAARAAAEAAAAAAAKKNS